MREFLASVHPSAWMLTLGTPAPFQSHPLLLSPPRTLYGSSSLSPHSPNRKAPHRAPYKAALLWASGCQWSNKYHEGPPLCYHSIFFLTQRVKL